MAGLTEERLRVVAIIHALKAVGIRVKNWKNFLNGDSNCQQTFSQVKKKKKTTGNYLLLKILYHLLTLNLSLRRARHNALLLDVTCICSLNINSLTWAVQ